MYEQLKVPIGIISSAIPGSRIEPWMPKEAMTALPYFQQQTDASHKVDGDPGKFYSTMIEPLAPFAIKGFLWYQGESNCFLNERLQYAYKMKALINQWRNIWNNNNMPFYYVQIAPYAYSTVKDSLKSYTQQSLPEFWEAQSLALNIPNTAMVATVDLNPNLPDLHPVNKWDVGKRLALCALSKTYHIKNVTATGPLYSNMKIAGNQIELGFDYTGNGLTSKVGQPLQGFEIAGADGKYVTATAIIQNNKVYVSAEAIQHPANVRYNWSEAAQASLYNKDGLPALPFRTDNPLIKQFK